MTSCEDAFWCPVTAKTLRRLSRAAKPFFASQAQAPPPLVKEMALTEHGHLSPLCLRTRKRRSRGGIVLSNEGARRFFRGRRSSNELPNFAQALGRRISAIEKWQLQIGVRKSTPKRVSPCLCARGYQPRLRDRSALAAFATDALRSGVFPAYFPRIDRSPEQFERTPERTPTNHASFKTSLFRDKPLPRLLASFETRCDPPVPPCRCKRRSGFGVRGLDGLEEPLPLLVHRTRPLSPVRGVVRLGGRTPLSTHSRAFCNFEGPRRRLDTSCSRDEESRR
jgi:hypothetical protein